MMISGKLREIQESMTDTGRRVFITLEIKHGSAEESQVRQWFGKQVYVALNVPRAPLTADQIAQMSGVAVTGPGPSPEIVRVEMDISKISTTRLLNEIARRTRP